MMGLNIKTPVAVYGKKLASGVEFTMEPIPAAQFTRLFYHRPGANCVAQYAACALALPLLFLLVR